jgi:hypothetical protein
MKNIYNLFFTGVWGLIIFSSAPSLAAAPKKTEAELIQMLHSANYKDVIDALDRLPNWYPNSTNAIQVITEILKNKEVLPPTILIKKTGSRGGQSVEVANNVPPDLLSRKAARALGNYHAKLDADDLNIIYGFLGARDPDVVMDGLKTLRGLPVPQAVPEILPLLKDENHNILRDSCRTLAVLGDTNAIPFIEPLLKDSRLDVRRDAQDAINKLRAKP